MQPSEKTIFYKNYKGPKCSRNAFYVGLREGLSMNEAIQPRIQNRGNHGNNGPRGKYFEDLQRYDEYEGEKPKRCTFYERLKSGYTREQAIRVEYFRYKTEERDYVHKRKEIENKREEIKKKLKTRKTVYTGIDVTYTIEEGKVFLEEFERMIQKQKEIIKESDDFDAIKTAEKQLLLIEKDFKIFKKHNFILFKN